MIPNLPTTAQVQTQMPLDAIMATLAQIKTLINPITAILAQIKTLPNTNAALSTQSNRVERRWDGRVGIG